MLLNVFEAFVDDQANGGWFLFYWGLMRLWVRNLRTLAQFQGDEKCLQGFSKTLWIGI